jgi:hypothetical protein
MRTDGDDAKQIVEQERRRYEKSKHHHSVLNARGLGLFADAHVY